MLLPSLQITSPAAAAWLLAVFGVQISSARPVGALLAAGGSSSTELSSPVPPTPVPADTLQLVLDYLHTYLALMAATADGHSTVSLAAPAACTPSNTSSRTPHTQRVEGGGPGSLSASVAAALQRMSPSSAGVFVMQLKANCWMLLGRLLLVASRQPALRAQQGEVSCSSIRCFYIQRRRLCSGCGQLLAVLSPADRLLIC